MTDTNAPVADETTIGQAGDMRFTPNLGTPFRDRDGLDALTKAAQNDAQNVTALKPEEKGTGNASADKLIELAKTQLGVNYQYGAHQWGKALDCSGFTQEVFARAGIAIGGSTYSQVTQGSEVSDIGQAKPGDLVFFTGDVGMRRNGHVGIYLGGGMMIDAPHTGAQVRIEPIHANPTAIRRFL